MSTSGPPRTIDELLDRAVQAINSGDRVTASALAQQVLDVDSGNRDAEDLLASPAAGTGELRRLTILFADMVDSTALSTRIEPEIYRTVIGRYRQQVKAIIDRYEGHVSSTKGDGLLAVFGHPRAHENDVRRAAQAGGIQAPFARAHPWIDGVADVEVGGVRHQDDRRHGGLRR